MATSQNGWQAIPSGSDGRLVTIPKIIGRVRGGDVATVFTDLIERFDATVEDIDRGADDWGYAYRPVRAGSDMSNHASGTAIDINATQHPIGRRGTFTAAQVAAIRKILARYHGAVRWGGDYSGRPDEMHFEINASPAHLAQVVRQLNTKEDDDMSWNEKIHKWYPGDKNGKDTMPAGQQLNQARGYAQEAYDRVRKVDSKVTRLERKMDRLIKALEDTK